MEALDDIVAIDGGRTSTPRRPASEVGDLAAVAGRVLAVR